MPSKALSEGTITGTATIAGVGRVRVRVTPVTSDADKRARNVAAFLAAGRKKSAAFTAAYSERVKSKPPRHAKRLRTGSRERLGVSILTTAPRGRERRSPACTRRASSNAARRSESPAPGDSDGPSSRRRLLCFDVCRKPAEYWLEALDALGRVVDRAHDQRGCQGVAS